MMPKAVASSAPSLAITFVSVACGLAGAIFGFYLAYRVFQFSVQASAAVATLSLLGLLSGTAAWLVHLSGGRNTYATIGLGCAVLFMMLLFLGGCALAGSVLLSILLA